MPIICRHMGQGQMSMLGTNGTPFERLCGVVGVSAFVGGGWCESLCGVVGVRAFVGGLV